MSAFARTLNQFAMQHGGRFWAILASACAGLLLAVAVYTFEPPRLPTNPAPLMTFLATDEFEAVSFIEEGANAATAPSEPPARNDEQAAQLFGMETEPVTAGELPEKWRHVEAAMARDFAVGCAVSCKWDLPCRRAKIDRHKCDGRGTKPAGPCGPDQQSSGPRHQPGR
jgi:hypothetical protein